MGTSVGSFALMLCLTVLSALPVRIVQRTSSPLCTALFNQWLSDMLDNLVILLTIPPLQSFWLQMLSHDPMHRWAEGSTWLRFLMIFLPQSPICLYGFFYHERSPSARALWGRWSPRRSKDRRCHGPEGCPGGRCWKSIARWQLDLELCHHNSSQYHWKLCATHRRHESKASSASEMEKENTWNHEQKKKKRKRQREKPRHFVSTELEVAWPLVPFEITFGSWVFRMRSSWPWWVPWSAWGTCQNLVKCEDGSDPEAKNYTMPFFWPLDSSLPLSSIIPFFVCIHISILSLYYSWYPCSCVWFCDGKIIKQRNLRHVRRPGS